MSDVGSCCSGGPVTSFTSCKQEQLKARKLSLLVLRRGQSPGPWQPWREHPPRFFVHQSGGGPGLSPEPAGQPPLKRKQPPQRWSTGWGERGGQIGHPGAGWKATPALSRPARMLSDQFLLVPRGAGKLPGY